MKNFILIFGLAFMFTGVAHADQVIQGIHESTSYAQEIGLAICALGGVLGGVLMAFNNESGASWMGKAIVSVSAIGAIPFLVKAIGGFFNIG